MGVNFKKKNIEGKAAIQDLQPDLLGNDFYYELEIYPSYKDKKPSELNDWLNQDPNNYYENIGAISLLKTKTALPQPADLGASVASISRLAEGQENQEICQIRPFPFLLAIKQGEIDLNPEKKLEEILDVTKQEGLVDKQLIGEVFDDLKKDVLLIVFQKLNKERADEYKIEPNEMKLFLEIINELSLEHDINKKESGFTYWNNNPKPPNKSLIEQKLEKKLPEPRSPEIIAKYRRDFCEISALIQKYSGLISGPPKGKHYIDSSGQEIKSFGGRTHRFIKFFSSEEIQNMNFAEDQTKFLDEDDKSDQEKLKEMGIEIPLVDGPMGLSNPNPLDFAFRGGAGHRLSSPSTPRAVMPPFPNPLLPPSSAGGLGFPGFAGPQGPSVRRDNFFFDASSTRSSQSGSKASNPRNPLAGGLLSRANFITISHATDSVRPLTPGIKPLAGPRSQVHRVPTTPPMPRTETSPRDVYSQASFSERDMQSFSFSYPPLVTKNLRSPSSAGSLHSKEETPSTSPEPRSGALLMSPEVMQAMLRDFMS